METPSSSAGNTADQPWSDAICAKIALESAFPEAVKDLSVQKNIIVRFLDFYLGKRPQKGLTVTDLVFSVISIMPENDNTEAFIWESKHYKKDGTLFFLSAEERLQNEIKNIEVKTPEAEEKSDVTDEQSEVEEETSSDETEELSEKTGSDYSDANVQTEPKYDKITAKLLSKKMPETPKYEHKHEMDGGRKEKKQVEESPECSTSFKVNNDEMNIPILPSDLKWYYRNPKPQEGVTKPPFGPLANSAFVFSCNKLLNEWETNQKGRIVLKYFFAIVALILMRATTKKYLHLVTTLTSSKFLAIISFASGFINYYPPHKRCYKGCYRTFRKRDGNIPFMFAKIVTNSLRIDQRRKLRGINKPKLNIFKVTLLSHTADYGLGLLSMLQSLAKLTDLNRIVQATYCEETANSWEKLKKFLETYMISSSNEATYHWARIINNSYFKHLSCSTNFALSVILAVFIEKMTKNSDIWKSSWATSGSNIDMLKRVASDMYSHLQKKSPFQKVYDVYDPINTFAHTDSIQFDFLSFCDTDSKEFDIFENIFIS